MDFNQLYTTHVPRLQFIAYQYVKDCFLAEDIVQEAFFKAYRKMDSIDDPAKIGAWLSAITVRTAIDFLRMEKRKGCMLLEHSLLEPIAGLCGNKEDLEDEVCVRLFQEEIDKMLVKLPNNAQQILILKTQYGLKETEIADLLNLKCGTVKTRLYRARKQLKRCL
nr:RNA polymerase sigma factor [Bacillus rubiinfantis]